MKKLHLFIALIVMATFGFCSYVLAAKAKTSLTTVSGASLWDHMKKSNYRNWQMWPGKTALYPGTQPHGALLTTYVNDVAYKAIKAKKGKLPNGSIVVKENYMPDKSLGALTVMYKVKGFNSEANDWFWAKYMPDGKIEAEGKVEMCIGCHGMKKDNDYVLTAPLK